MNGPHFFFQKKKSVLKEVKDAALPKRATPQDLILSLHDFRNTHAHALYLITTLPKRMLL